MDVDQARADGSRQVTGVTTRGDARWLELVDQAEVTRDGRLTLVQVVHAGLAGARDDVVLCPAAEVERRLASLKASGRTTLRLAQPERMFMARALGSDPATAVAMIVRSIIARWTALRGRRTVIDEHECHTMTLIEAHLERMGHAVGGDILAARDQLPATQVRAPLAHDGSHDVVRKAMGQFANQIAGRHIIVVGGSERTGG